jgi:branched-chain amino acid transport system permease protein
MTRRLGISWLGLGAFVVAVVVVALLPLTLSDYHRSTGAGVAVFFVAILALDIVTGYTGQISIGHGAFMAVGGYTTAILLHHHWWNHATGGGKILLTLPAAALLGFAAGIVVGLPALRFHGVYLALTTFAVALAVPQLAKNYTSFTGGTEGLSLPEHNGMWLYRTGWIVAGIAFVLAWLLLRGRTGRAFRAVRDSEVAAASSGVSLSVYKTLAFGISAAFAAVAGSVYVLVNNFVNPDVFGLTLSLYILIGAVVGGLGSLWGVIAGAAFVQLLPIGLTTGHLTSSQTVPVIFGAVVIAVMAVLPLGAASLLRTVLRFASRSRQSPDNPLGLEGR